MPTRAVFLGVPLVVFAASMLSCGSTTVAAQACSGCPCNPVTNRSALMAFYHSTQGPQWDTGATWGTALPICNWAGVNCSGVNGTGTGVVLDLSKYVVDGVFPDDFGAHLPNLAGVDIHFSGATTMKLPPSLSRAPQLTRILLVGCFTGVLPSAWGVLTELRTISIDTGFCTSNITGTLPSAWEGMTSLETLNLPTGALTGPLPSSWGMLKNLTYLSASWNLLNGTLPSSWAGMINLATLDLSHNRLSGPLPGSWATMSGLLFLSLRHNLITGSVPDEWWAFTPPTLDLSWNALDGTVPLNWSTPAEFPPLIPYYLIDVSRNHLRGSLPLFLNATPPTRVVLAFNNFTGSIPPAWYSSNVTFDVSYNQLSGTPNLCAFAIPPRLAYNDFTGRPNIDCFQANATVNPCFNNTLEFDFLEGNHFCGICTLPRCSCAKSIGNTIAVAESIAVRIVSSDEECCTACQANSACVAAVLAPLVNGSRHCSLKNVSAPLVSKPGHTVLFRD